MTTRNHADQALLPAASSPLLERLGCVTPGMQRVVLLVLCVLLYAVWLQRVPLTEIDEARFTEATRMMVHTGNYLIPQFNAAPRYQKPILYYWVQAASVRLFGVNEAAARLPSALAAFALLLIIHGMLRRWLIRAARQSGIITEAAACGAAWVATLAAAVLPLLAIWARAAVTDPLLTLWISLALLALLDADMQRDPAGARTWYTVAAVAIALGMLTKGPVAVVIPLLTWLLYHASRRTLRTAVTQAPWGRMIGLFLLIAAPWYVATYLLDGPAFVTHFFLTENLQRYASPMERHGMGRLLGLLIVPAMGAFVLFPATPLLARELLQPFAGARAFADDDVLARLRRFCWCWFIAVFGFFAFSGTQLPSYLQSVVAPAAALIALHLLGRAHAVPERRAPVVVETVLFALFGVLWYGGMLYALSQLGLEGPLGFVPFPHSVAMAALVVIAVLGIAMIVGIVLTFGKPAATPLAVLAIWTATMLLMLLLVAPLAVSSSYGLSVRLGSYLRTLPPEDAIVTATPHTSESLVYYARHPISFMAAQSDALPDTLQSLLQSHPRVALLARRDRMPTLPRWLRAVEIHADGDYRVLRVTMNAKEQP